MANTPLHPDTDITNNDQIDISERDILTQQIAVSTPDIHYFQLFRYATKKDLIIIAISSLCAIIAGAITTLPALLTALLIGSIQESASSNPSQASASSELTRFTIYFVYLFVGELVTCYIAMIGFIRTGIVLSSRIREQYLAALLRQNMAFFDNIGAGEIATHITADTNLIRDGISEKVSIAVQCCSSVITVFVIGFIRDWKLTLIMASGPLCIAIVFAVGSVVLTRYRMRWFGETAEAGTVAEEAFSSI
jgi:ATP-binding cassette subfamily B (MDR/TAP) protein 1